MLVSRVSAYMTIPGLVHFKRHPRSIAHTHMQPMAVVSVASMLFPVRPCCSGTYHTFLVLQGTTNNSNRTCAWRVGIAPDGLRTTAAWGLLDSHLSRPPSGRDSKFDFRRSGGMSLHLEILRVRDASKQKNTNKSQKG